ncbi:hypothetical protein F4818DRAFT_441384 [Hypoxylon cercidicola]|nr:hypothetical protein F4818DRAFT_441384 [Hypoxylon cercidicola]
MAASLPAAREKVIDEENVIGNFSEMVIMPYLDRVYGKQARESDQNPSAPLRQDIAKAFTRFQQGLSLLVKYRAIANANAFEHNLRIWEEYAAEEHDFIAGPTMTLADYAFWPSSTK